MKKNIIGISISCVCCLAFSLYLSSLKDNKDVFARYREQTVVESIANSDKYGYVCLSLGGVDPSEKIRILVNGYPIDYFDKLVKHVSVTDSSLIEIDGYDLNKEFFVEITEQSDNLQGEYLGQEIRVFSEIVALGNINLK